MKIVLAIDTSGSTSPGNLIDTVIYDGIRQHIHEIVNGPFEVDAFCFDERTYPITKFNDTDLQFEKMTLVGGGGTYITGVFEKIIAENINPDAIIIATDGFFNEDYSQYSEIFPNILWIMLSEDSNYVKPIWGTVITI